MNAETFALLDSTIDLLNHTKGLSLARTGTVITMPASDIWRLMGHVTHDLEQPSAPPARKPATKSSGKAGSKTSSKARSKTSSKAGSKSSSKAGSKTSSKATSKAMGGMGGKGKTLADRFPKSQTANRRTDRTDQGEQLLAQLANGEWTSAEKLTLDGGSSARLATLKDLIARGAVEQRRDGRARQYRRKTGGAA